MNRKPRASCVSDPQRDFTFTVSPGANLLAAYRPGPPHALGRRRAFSRVTEEEWLIAVVVQALATVGTPGLGRRRMAEIRRPGSERTAPHRLHDLADVLRLVREAALPRDFALQLDPYVRPKYEELWTLAQHPDEDY